MPSSQRQKDKKNIDDSVFVNVPVSTENMNDNPAQQACSSSQAQNIVVNKPVDVCIWNALEVGVDKIFHVEQQKISKREYMILYNLIYKYVTEAQQSSADDVAIDMPSIVDQLFNKIREVVSNYLKNVLKDSESKLDETNILKFYVKYWEEYQFSAKVLNGVCQYLNRFWLKQNYLDDVREIYLLTLIPWRENLFEPLKERIRNAVSKLIERERKGEITNTYLLGDVIKSFVKLGLQTEGSLILYRDLFEKQFLEETERFYLNESVEFLKNNSVNEYVRKVNMRLNEEYRRIQQYVHESTSHKLLDTCKRVLVTQHLETFFLEFKNLLDKDAEYDLGHIYELLSRVKPNLHELASFLQKYILQKGREAIEKITEAAINNSRVYVNAIIEIHEKYRMLIITNLKSDPKFVRALDKACYEFINDNSVTRRTKVSSKSAELLAKYSDLLLSHASKIVEDTKLESGVNRIILIYKFIEDKDVFYKFFYKMLAHRLVHDTPASDHAIFLIISRLKSVGVSEYTSKLQRMYQDRKVSDDLNNSFRKQLENNPLDIDFNIKIVPLGTWPFQQSSELISLPIELEHCVQRFSTFYKTLHTGRKLNWLYNMSWGELVTNCFKNKYTLQASTYEIAILLLFNVAQSWTVANLIEMTLINPDYLIQVLQILIKSKLLQSADEDNLTTSSVVSLFTAYNNKKFRVNLNIPLKLELKKEQEVTQMAVENDRRILIQAAVVRIMKMRKSLKHQQLLIEIVNQVSSRFKPSIPFIKRCIDMLIEREYIKRKDDEPDVYNYLA